MSIGKVRVVLALALVAASCAKDGTVSTLAGSGEEGFFGWPRKLGAV